MVKVGDINTFAAKGQFFNSLDSNYCGPLQEYSLVISDSSMHAQDEHVSRYSQDNVVTKIQILYCH